MIPALVAGVDELILASPPTEDGFPDRYILAAAALASGLPSVEKDPGRRQTNVRVFAIGGAQAIAALALGTETVPKAGIIVGPGNKYVAAAKRMLFGEVGIDFVAGPTDVLVITGDKPSSRLPAGPGGTDTAAALAAADMLAQAEHDPDARARALVPNRVMAENVAAALELGLERLVEQRGAAAVAAETAGASLEAGGLIVVYHSKEAAIRIANKIAPEHLELQMENTEDWIPALKNYGSLFIGGRSAEVLGDYSAGINHTLPTSGSARFSGGLSVRHFLKTVTTLRCDAGNGFEKARKAAEIMGTAEGLAFHAQSAALRGDRTL
jgi:histidinol dehydrogenase